VGDLGLTHVDELIEAMDRGKASIASLISPWWRFTEFVESCGGAGAWQALHHATLQDEHRIAANLHFWRTLTAELLEVFHEQSPLGWK